MRTILPPKARTIPDNAKLVFKGQIFDVYQWDQELYDGSHAVFEMMRRPDTVQIIAIKDHKMVVTDEMQPGSRENYYALPGGRHDNDAETELEAAQRELLEETGLSFREWRLLEVRQPVAKIEWFVYTFLATGYESEVPVHLDAGEKINVELLDRDQVLGLSGQTRPGYLPLELLEQVKSVDELANLPEYGAQA